MVATMGLVLVRWLELE